MYRKLFFSMLMLILPSFSWTQGVLLDLQSELMVSTLKFKNNPAGFSNDEGEVTTNFSLSISTPIYKLLHFRAGIGNNHFSNFNTFIFDPRGVLPFTGISA